MNTQEKFKLGSWISRNTGQDFHWGVWDCNIFFVEYHDMMYGTNDLDRIYKKYIDRRSGIRLLKSMGLTSTQWLTIKGYKQLKTTPKKLLPGDVAVLDHKLYASVYIYFEGAWWSVQEDTGLRGYTPDAVKKAKPTWWRKDG